MAVMVWSSRIDKGFIHVSGHCIYLLLTSVIPGRIGQVVTCLATDANLTADPGVASPILVPYFCGD